MNEKTKEGIKRMAEDAETGIARSILRWKYKKEGISPPGEDDLESQARRVTETARRVISERGENVWSELKKVYAKSRGMGESSK
jgi:hypothetical protein